MKKKIIVVSSILLAVAMITYVAWGLSTTRDPLPTPTTNDTRPNNSSCGAIITSDKDGKYASCEVIIASTLSAAAITSLIGPISGQIKETAGTTTMYYTITVPAGTEKQSIDYLTGKDGILSASLNHISSPTAPE